MAVSVSHFDYLPDGREIQKITLTNGVGTAVSVLTFGATLQSFLFEDRDIVLGSECVADYLGSGAYIGATVGRVCNRTADGRLTLNGTEYRVACTEPQRQVHLHGGLTGFDKKVWDYTIVCDGDAPRVQFSVTSPDGDEGYPGNLMVSVTYSLAMDNTLSLEYMATTDADTPVNLTNHVYFNLNGCGGDKVYDTMLRINAEQYTPVTERLIPTGEYASVAGTALDFRKFKAIGDALHNEDATMAYTGGVDHNFVLAHDRRPLSEAACAYSPATGICVTCCTDLPGIQVYTGNFLEDNPGKYGHTWQKHDGFCLETQFFPDSVNNPQFPSAILAAGAEFRSCTTYRVDRIDIPGKE